MNIEQKTFDFDIIERKQEQINGIDVGVIKGYLAAWSIDRIEDRFVRGCFSDSIKQHIEKGRQIRMKAYHSKIIGGFPIEKVYEDEKGLFVEGHVNLVTQEGKEVYALAKQGVISDMSIGFSADEVTFEDNVRVISKATIWEGSLVDEPANVNANITEVKAINARDVLPKDFADRSILFNLDEAVSRIKSWAGAENEPTTEYKSAFMFYDQENEESFEGYKLLVSDIVDGQIKIIPRAVFAVRAVLSDVKGGVDISSQDKEKAKGIVNTLYKEMGLDEPFKNGKARPFSLTEIKHMPISFLSHVIRKKELSKDASDYVAQGAMTRMVNDTVQEKDIEDFVSTIKNLRKELKK